MDNYTNKSPIFFIGLTRENLYESICDSLAPQDSACDIFQKNKKETALVKEKGESIISEVRYFEEKSSFLIMLFDPMLETYVAYRKNTNFDYMTGLHLFMSSNPNFNYGYGLFKKTIPIFDTLIDHWNDFLESVINDIHCLPPINLKETIVLKLEDLLCFRINNNKIENATVDLSCFDSIWKVKDRNYGFRIVLVSNGKPQPLVSGKGNGKGEQSDLYKTILWLNKLAGTKEGKRQK